MFCPKCGTQLSEHATVCTNCGTPVGSAAGGGAGAAAGATADRVKAASKDAVSAFMGFVGDPVGGLAPAAHSLGSSRTLGVGIIFGLVFAVLFTFALNKGLGMFFGFGLGGDGVAKMFLTALVPFVAFTAAAFGVRSISSGRGGLGEDAFLAGAALLPFGVAMGLSAILGLSSLELLMFLNVFALCFTVMMIYAGLSNIYGLSPRAASLWVPVVFIASFYITKLIAGALMSSGGPADFGGGFDNF